MKKINNIKVFILIIMIIGILLITFNIKFLQTTITNVKIMIYGEPINLETGEINNQFFDINESGQEAEKTTKGINDAIDYASKNNINYIKLKKGTYEVIGYNNSHYRGISLKSNIHMDLNGSTIIQKTNAEVGYANITLYNVENVKISNGILIGDKESHDYSQIESTHEAGFGVSISAGTNIEIENLQIYNMTGDGIFIWGINEGEKSPDGVIIKNCNIHDCRRQGISILCGKNISIYDNEIHDISGTDPQAAIDLESVSKKEEIDNVYIERNKFYNLNTNLAVLFVGFINNASLKENEINGDLLIYDAKEKLEITNNTISNGNVKLLSDYTNINAGHNLNEVYINNNTLNNAGMTLRKIMDLKVFNNQIINGNIEVISSNADVENNVISNNMAQLEYALVFSNMSGHTERYVATIKNNITNGNFNEVEKVDINYYTVTR